MTQKDNVWKKVLLICFIVIVAGLTTFNFFRSQEGKNIFNLPQGQTKEITQAAAGDLFGIYAEQPNTNYIKYVKPVKAKGIYLSEWTLSSKAKRDYWINVINETEVNAIVLNVKNDDGKISFDMNAKVAKEIGATNGAPIKDMKSIVAKMKENGIYPIARIVAFKDPYLAEKRPDLAIKDETGAILRLKTPSGKVEAWVNPYNHEVWEYIIDVSKEAAVAGFEEIQFDYIRFSTARGIERANFGEKAKDKSKTDIITEFTKYAVSELKPLGVYVSADVYGTIINSDVDSKIVGQDYTEMARHLDYICPMVYPSHYGNGAMGVKYPDLQPYDTILKAMQLSEARLNKIPEGEHRAIVRPWLQDFTATWIKPYQKYTAQQIREQKKGVYDAKLEEWILWDANNRYTLDGLEKK